MIRDYLRAKVVKLLSRVIRQVNIHCCYSKKVAGGALLPSDNMDTRSLCMVCFLVQIEAKR